MEFGINSCCFLLFFSLNKLWGQGGRHLHSLQLLCFGSSAEQGTDLSLPGDLFHTDTRCAGESPGLALLLVPDHRF